MPSLIIAWLAADQRERGATAVEYGLVVGLVSGVIVVLLVGLGPAVVGVVQTASDLLP